MGESSVFRLVFTTCSSWGRGWCSVGCLNLLRHRPVDTLLVRLETQPSTLSRPHGLYQSLTASCAVLLTSSRFAVLDDMFTLWAAVIVPMRLQIFFVDSHLSWCLRRCRLGRRAGISRAICKSHSFPLGPDSALMRHGANFCQRVCVPPFPFGPPGYRPR